MAQEEMSSKRFLSGALAALLFSGAEPFMQFWKRASLGTFRWFHMIFWPVLQEEEKFLSRALATPLFSGLEPFLQFEKASWETILWNYFEFGQKVQEEMPFKGISYLELWQLFCSAEHNHLCHFGRGYYEEQFSENILNLGQWFRRRCGLKDFLSGALAALLFCRAEPFMQFWKRASWGTFMWRYMRFR